MLGCGPRSDDRTSEALTNAWWTTDVSRWWTMYWRAVRYVTPASVADSMRAPRANMVVTRARRPRRLQWS